MYEQYKEIVEEYKKAAWGIFDEDFSYQQEAELADAYCGDAGYVSRYVETLEKPVLLQKMGISRNVDGQPLVQMLKMKKEIIRIIFGRMQLWMIVCISFRMR